MAANGAPAPAAARGDLPQMQTAGHAPSTLRAKSAAVNNFVKFLKSTDGKYPETMEAVPAATLCGKAIWLEYAHFLVHDTRQLKADTVIEYMRKTFNVVKDAHGGTGSPHYEFFAALANKDSHNNWLMGAIRQVNVHKFEEATANGLAMSAQATPLYTWHRRALVKAYLRRGTNEAVLRAAVIQSNGASAGRPGEISGFSPDVMSWDPLFKCVVAVWPQMKTHKHKIVVIGAGHDRLICPVHVLGVAHAQGCFKTQVFDEDGLNHFFPSLSEGSNVSTVISNWLKAMVCGSKNTEYQMHQVAGLPADVSAAGQRTGAINEMAHGGVSAELSAHVSGHDFENLSTLWYYLRPSVAMVIPGARVLLGWASLPYGQLGRGPTPASLTALCDGGFASMDTLDALTDKGR
ncbi:hypothetical protein M885DRAFT_528617 [Pelagophyceae sp. CCMP2097]|nr:hypothetical protein M885DRAFT_528617 [Pelagophyceae sp. CCMP2097]